MANRKFTFLGGYSIFLKVLSAGTVLAGLVVIGVVVYAWGKLTAFYDVIRTALAAMAGTSSDLAQSLLLPEIPLWPLLLLILVLLGLMIIIALTFWAAGDLIDLKLKQADEEREARRLQRKAIESVLQSLKLPVKPSVAGEDR